MFNSNGIFFIPNSVTKFSLFVCLVYLIFFLLIEIFVQFSMYFFLLFILSCTHTNIYWCPLSPRCEIYIYISFWFTSEYVLVFPVSFSFPHQALQNMLFTFPHITFFKFSSHCWFQFTWFGWQRPYLVWFTLLMVIPWLNIVSILRNILEIIPCKVETDVYSSVLFWVECSANLCLVHWFVLSYRFSFVLSYRLWQ